MTHFIMIYYHFILEDYYYRMEDPTRTDVEEQTKDSGSRKDSNELSQQSAVMTPLLTAGENEDSLEGSPETEKKKKKRKKKKAEMTKAVPDSTEQLLPSLVSNAEETSGNTDLRSQGPSVKEYEEPDPVKDIPANKKKKNKKKTKLSNVSEDELKTGDVTEKQLDNQDIHVTSAPKEEKSNSGIAVEDQGDIAVRENERHENDVGTKSQKECDNASSTGFGNDSKNLSRDSSADSTATRKDENAPASEKEESSISDNVPSEVKPESSTISDGAKESHIDTGPEEEVESDSSDYLSDDADNEG